MEPVISATEARVHFGALMRRVVERNEAVVVEHGGRPQIVLLSVAEYERLRARAQGEQRGDPLGELLELGDQIRARRAGEPLPAADEVIHQMREERDADVDSGLGLR